MTTIEDDLFSASGVKSPNEKLVKNEMYLQLFHGRKSPDEQLDNWGTDGPVFGPLQFCHTTYGCHIKLGYLDDDGLESRGDLHVIENLVYYDGVYYGDWSVFLATDKVLEDPYNLEVDSFKERLVPYEESKSIIPNDLNTSTKQRSKGSTVRKRGLVKKKG